MAEYRVEERCSCGKDTVRWVTSSRPEPDQFWYCGPATEKERHRLVYFAWRLYPTKRRTYVAQCKTCTASVRWASTREGRWLPFDEEPVPNGEWLLDMDVQHGDLVARKRPKDVESEGYRDHICELGKKG